GNNLLSGLANLLQDLERGQGRLAITMTSSNTFSISKDVATTPGKVILQNDLMQLIQYTPTTAQVRRRPFSLSLRGLTNSTFSISDRKIRSYAGQSSKAILYS